ncbi:MAG: threonine/serine exporter family protein [Synergistaceae bacterium]|nr:threonine/serine exporter family protein [Synergistaceae bacterium]
MTRDIDYILEFCVSLSRSMIMSGANLERIHTAVMTVCRAYGLHEVSVYLLSSHMSVSAYDSEGNYSSRQISIHSSGIHLDRLRSLNQLSYKVAEIRPAPKTLSQMLDRAMNVGDYPELVVLGGKICAMLCLGVMFGATLWDAVPIVCVTALIHFLMGWLERSGLDRMLVNSLTMGAAASVALAFIYSGFNGNFAVIMITVSMLVIPGIPLVNAMRNLLCGNESNGILQMLKISVETMALALGIYGAFLMFGVEGMISPAISAPTNPAVLVALSFTASVGFGVVFRIPVKDLWLAGLGGALSRVCVVYLPGIIAGRFGYMTLSASAAALYAEFLAIRRKQPSTYFVYPSIIPLIPGDLFYFAITGIYLGAREWVELNGVNCLISLAGLSMGFVLASTAVIYLRRGRIRIREK